MSKKSRHCSPYTSREKIGRVLWSICQNSVFRWSPRFFWGFRNWLLRRFGACIGSQVHIYNTTHILQPWMLTVGDHTAIGDNAILYNIGPLTIGSHVTVSQLAHLCGGTHDYRVEEMPLIRSPINIGDHVWVCAEAFVGPWVNIGEGAIVGARAVVVRDVESLSVVCGNPAKVIKYREPLLPSHRKDSKRDQ